MPLDAEPAERPTGLYQLLEQPDQTFLAFSAAGMPVYISHFATCPNADQHRKA